VLPPAWFVNRGHRVCGVSALHEVHKPPTYESPDADFQRSNKHETGWIRPR
jgi:hypothetical protein